MSSSVSSRGGPPQSPKPRLVSDLDYALLKRLGDRLDVPGEGNWRRLISALSGVRVWGVWSMWSVMCEGGCVVSVSVGDTVVGTGWIDVMWWVCVELVQIYCRV